MDNDLPEFEVTPAALRMGFFVALGQRSKGGIFSAAHSSTGSGPRRERSRLVSLASGSVTAELIPSALEKDRWYKLRLERRRLTPADAFACDEPQAKANCINRYMGRDPLSHRDSLLSP
jgi:hypothetical protein